MIFSRFARICLFMLMCRHADNSLLSRFKSEDIFVPSEEEYAMALQGAELGPDQWYRDGVGLDLIRPGRNYSRNNYEPNELIIQTNTTREVSKKNSEKTRFIRIETPSYDLPQGDRHHRYPSKSTIPVRIIRLSENDEAIDERAIGEESDEQEQSDISSTTSSTSTKRMPFMTLWPQLKSTARYQNKDGRRRGRYGTKQVASCFECGVYTSKMPSDSSCHDVFNSPDWRLRTKWADLRLRCVLEPNKGDFYWYQNEVYRHKVYYPYYIYTKKKSGQSGVAIRRESPHFRPKGGCYKNFLDIGTMYTERGCRHVGHGRHVGSSWASHRYRRLQMLLEHVEDGCIGSPHASLTPFQRGVSLFARFKSEDIFVPSEEEYAMALQGAELGPDQWYRDGVGIDLIRPGRNYNELIAQTETIANQAVPQKNSEKARFPRTETPSYRLPKDDRYQRIQSTLPVRTVRTITQSDELDNDESGEDDETIDDVVIDDESGEERQPDIYRTSTKRMPFITRWPKARNTTLDQSYRRGYYRGQTASCYECGIDSDKFPSNSYCHDVFDSPDWRLRKKWWHLRVRCIYNSNSRESDKREGKQFRQRWFPPNDKGLARKIESPRLRRKGGCYKNFLDVGTWYTERGCRWYDFEHGGKSWVSHRYRRLELLLHDVEDGCVGSPHASLTPFQRGVSLFARYYVCVCSKPYCNIGVAFDSSLFVMVFVLSLLCI